MTVLAEEEEEDAVVPFMALQKESKICVKSEEMLVGMLR